MKLGICGPVERMPAAKAIGYDYLEPAVAPIAALSEEAFEALCREAAAGGLPVETMNVLLPGALSLTGPAVDQSAIRQYLEGAFARAAVLGAQVIVFGSGGARRVPDGFDHDAALDQIADFLRLCESLVAPKGLRIAIEPLCKKECNILNTVGEATALARKLSLPHVGVLGDTYHMYVEGEPLTALSDAGSLLLHVHVANPVGRLFPRPGDGQDYAAIFQTLRGIGYGGRVSVEVGQDAFDPGASEAFAALDPLRG